MEVEDFIKEHRQNVRAEDEKTLEIWKSAKSKPSQWWKLLFLDKPVKHPSKATQNTSK